MKIKYKDFEIELGENSYDLFQIRPPKQIHKNKKVGKLVRICHGYFTKVDSCIERIIMIELSARREIINLKDFLKVYKGLCEEVKRTIYGMD